MLLGTLVNQNISKTFLPDCTFVVRFVLELDDMHQILIVFQTVNFSSISLQFSSKFNYFNLCIEFLATDPEVPSSIPGPTRFSEK
jgi:hypothetical protein